MEELAVSLRAVINNAPLTKSQVKIVLKSLIDEEFPRFSVHGGPDAAAGAFCNEGPKVDIEDVNHISIHDHKTELAPQRVGFLMIDPRYLLHKNISVLRNRPILPFIKGTQSE